MLRFLFILIIIEFYIYLLTIMMSGDKIMTTCHKKAGGYHANPDF